MAYGISELSIVPVRGAESERSEMVTQILFGEMFEILRLTDKWVQVRLLNDGYEGWIDRKMYQPVSDAYAQDYGSKRHFLARDVFNIVEKEGEYGSRLLVSGSVFPFFEPDTGCMRVGDDVYRLASRMKSCSGEDVRTSIISNALMYLNTPYLWGGRTPYGIDCSGLTQMAYRLAGIDLPRDASQQVRQGEDLSFVEEARPGDLAFFGDAGGAVTHVGLIWQNNRIIHSSGKVRVDKIDHQGIFNGGLKRYTHNLKAIKRILKD